MKSTEISAGKFEVASISDGDMLDAATLSGAATTYRLAFEQPPYREAFTDDEASSALHSILEKEGDLVIGKIGREVVSLAGGYTRADGVYYIEELAVRPSRQGFGLGRRTLQALLGTRQASSARRLEIRTNSTNKAILLYESEGFEREEGTEVVAQARRDGRIGLDERVYLSNPPLGRSERLKELKRVAIAYPSGNTTAVVFDQLLSSDREQLNLEIMQAWGLKRPGDQEVEQCCFVTLPKGPEAIARVEMFGGEFCGNATRSAAWLVTGGKNYEGLIEVSGAPRPLEFAVLDGEVSVEMPLPKSGRLVSKVAEGSLVQLDGIAQLVVTEQDRQERLSPRELLARLLAEDAYGLSSQPAVGVSYYERTSGKAVFCVWVRAVKTIFDETACGSGTSAIGIALANDSKESVELLVVQPSGETITTKAMYTSGSVVKSLIAGSVDVLYDGGLSLS